MRAFFTCSSGAGVAAAGGMLISPSPTIGLAAAAASSSEIAGCSTLGLRGGGAPNPMPFSPAASALMLPPVAPRERMPSTRLAVAEGEVGDNSGCCWPPNKLSRFAAMLPAAGGAARVFAEEGVVGVVAAAVSCDRGVVGVAVAAGGVVEVGVPGGFAPALLAVGEPKSAARFAAKLVHPSGEPRPAFGVDEAEEGDAREEAPPFDCDRDTR